MIGRLLLLARGQVRVRVTGASLPRFLNLCAFHGLVLRRMERTAWNELYATLSVRELRALRRYMGRTGCRVHIVQRRGAPFLLARLRGRPVLWSGLLGLAAVCWALSAHIWAIEAQIAPGLPAAEMMRQLGELGIRIGAPLRDIDVRSTRWRMMQLQPALGYLTITVRGNSVLVQAERRDLTGEKLDQSAVVKVVAARAGVVQSIRAREGQPVVQPGDAVSTGDTLISGLVPPTREEGGYRLAHAQGDVQAYTMRTVDAARALTVDEKTAPHRVRRQYALLIGNKRLNLYFGSGIAGASCDKMIEIRTLRLSESVVFPVSLVVQTYVERGRTPVTRTPDEVRVEMLSCALGAVASALDGSVLRHSETLTERQGAAVLHLSVHALEQIGVEAVDDSQLPPADAPPPADG